jgi:transcriptional regulator with XRE-family HTH domain
MNPIGNKIRLLREEKGLSQENLASALDITQSNYARLEKDDNRISVPRLIIIANTLETTVTELVGEVVAQDFVAFSCAGFQFR